MCFFWRLLWVLISVWAYVCSLQTRIKNRHLETSQERNAPDRVSSTLSTSALPSSGPLLPPSSSQLCPLTSWIQRLTSNLQSLHELATSAPECVLRPHRQDFKLTPTPKTSLHRNHLTNLQLAFLSSTKCLNLFGQNSISVYYKFCKINPFLTCLLLSSVTLHVGQETANKDIRKMRISCGGEEVKKDWTVLCYLRLNK